MIPTNHHDRWLQQTMKFTIVIPAQAGIQRSGPDPDCRRGDDLMHSYKCVNYRENSPCPPRITMLGVGTGWQLIHSNLPTGHGRGPQSQ